MKIEVVGEGGKAWVLVDLYSIKDKATLNYVVRHGRKTNLAHYRKLSWSEWQRRPGVKQTVFKGMYRLRPSYKRRNVTADLETDSVAVDLEIGGD